MASRDVKTKLTFDTVDLFCPCLIEHITIQFQVARFMMIHFHSVYYNSPFTSAMPRSLCKNKLMKHVQKHCNERHAMQNAKNNFQNARCMPVVFSTIPTPCMQKKRTPPL